MNEINDIVEQAFAAEESAQATPETQETEIKVEQPEPTEPKADDKPETKPEEAKPEEKKDEKPVEEEKPVESDAPKQLRREFADNHWKDLDDDTKAELTRLSNENERNYTRASEAEYRVRQMRKTLSPVQGYISEVAQAANIPENEVVRNCVDTMQKLTDNPTMMASYMIANRHIRFEDPVTVINTIAKTYGIQLQTDATPRNIPEADYNTIAKAKYEARQAKYAQPEETTDDIVQDYVNNTPGIKALLDNAEIRDRFLHQITMERNADPEASDIAIINKAAEIFDYLNKQPQVVAPQPQQPSLAEQKMAKVVSPTASNPVEQAPVKHEPLTPEQSVRETLRAMGLDD